MNVLVVAEDFRKDQYILKPIISVLLAHIGHGRAKVRVCTDPLIGGVSEALKWEVIEPILTRYMWSVDLFLLCVDRDGTPTRAIVLRSLEAKAQAKLGAGKWLLAEHAWQELEVWILAGHEELPKGWKWNEIRDERDSKERYYLPFAKQSGCLDHPAEGRGTLAIAAARNYKRIRMLCHEDIRNLEDRIAAVLRV